MRADVHAGPPSVTISNESVSTVAHELRAPLCVINGYLSLLADGSYGEPPEGWRQPLSVVRGKVDELSCLVEDLLLVAHNEGGVPPQLSPVHFDLRDAARAAVARARPRAVLLDGELALGMPNHPVAVHADVGATDRILDNLVNNALAYGGEHPNVQVDVDDASAEPTLRVRDHGAGVRREMRERIFDRFVRSDEWQHRPGSGLGLFIGRQLAERQGGSLTLEWSALGRGSTFALRLPAPTGVI